MSTEQSSMEGKKATEEEQRQYDAKREGDLKMQERINDPEKFARRQEREARKADRERRKEAGVKLSKGEEEQEKKDNEEEQKEQKETGTPEAEKAQVSVTTDDSKRTGRAARF